MTTLEHLKPGIHVKGVIPGQTAAIIDVKWHGSTAVEIYYKREDGQPGTQLLYRTDETSLEVVAPQRVWRFNADGAQFRLAAEAYRIRLAHLFDPVLAVHTSLIEPLPHQITGVYGDMLQRQPLRFLLADDPGAGKTIMAGLLLKELMVRGDVRRCLICVPGNLAAQWQDELWFKFQLRFDILTRETVETSVSGNPFVEKDGLIVRLDQVARDENLQDKLRRSEWDLAIVDEAHKMSAHFWAGDVQETRRYKLGKLLSRIARHFLLMTATPHNGKEEDFQLFLALLDADRFEGRFREGVHKAEVSDIMRRMMKEDLRRFDGRPLFPERKAYTVNYPLPPEEKQLYEAVTDYVREEFNRVEQLLDDQRKGTVGFALMILQRRLASSPEAIYQSLKRRRERLEKRLTDLNSPPGRGQGRVSPPGRGQGWVSPPGRGQGWVLEADATAKLATHPQPLPGGEFTDPPRKNPSLSEEQEWDSPPGREQEWVCYDQDFLTDLDDAPAEEAEQIEEQIMDNATAALTMAELQAEIDALARLERMAYRLRQSGTDHKWQRLAAMLQEQQQMFDANGQRRKLVLFTEHYDTLTYLRTQICTLFGRDDVLVSIYGSVPRQERRAIEDRFRNDPQVYFLLATDAAGEGLNLQRAHLMINYDLPWNPNRLEQRFGRIHRIGQTEVCHLWNLVSRETREGYVYERLLHKLAAESDSLQGKVFDVLGKLFEQTPLRTLLVEAIRYGDRPEVRARLEQAVDHAVDRDRIRALLETQSLAAETMDTSQIVRVREEMERYAARRLQPYYIQSFFLEAFEKLGGGIREREPGRFYISYVPALIRSRAKELGVTPPVWESYERVCFDKALMFQPGMAPADFICPGHPLLQTLIDLILDKHRETLRCGTVLVDPADAGQTPRLLYFLEQNIQDARVGSDGAKRVISREVHFVEIDRDGQIRSGGYAPYLDYEPMGTTGMVYKQEWETTGIGNKQEFFQDLFEGWEGLEERVLGYAIETMTPRHLERVRKRREELIDKTLAAVYERLTKEINYWDRRAAELRQQEKAGKVNVKLNAARARQRAEELAARLKRRTEELQSERRISAAPPVIIGAALVLPIGLLLGDRTPPELLDLKVTEAIAMQAVLQTETNLGHHPKDVSKENLGYDIESLDPVSGRLRFIEVKGRRAGAATVTVTRNEILCGLNAPDQYILAIVEVENGQPHPPRYIRRPFAKEPDFGVTSVNYDLKELQELGSYSEEEFTSRSGLFIA